MQNVCLETRKKVGILKHQKQKSQNTNQFYKFIFPKWKAKVFSGN